MARHVPGLFAVQYGDGIVSGIGEYSTSAGRCLSIGQSRIRQTCPRRKKKGNMVLSFLFFEAK